MGRRRTRARRARLRIALRRGFGGRGSRGRCGFVARRPAGLRSGGGLHYRFLGLLFFTALLVAISHGGVLFGAGWGRVGCTAWRCPVSKGCRRYRGQTCPCIFFRTAHAPAQQARVTRAVAMPHFRKQIGQPFGTISTFGRQATSTWGETFHDECNKGSK